jgi:vancomycin aglycone glucosyltransferase
VRVLLSTYDSRGGVEPLLGLCDALSTALTPQTRARATAVAGTIRTDGVTVAATLLLRDAASQTTATRS